MKVFTFRWPITHGRQYPATLLKLGIALIAVLLPEGDLPAQGGTRVHPDEKNLKTRVATAVVEQSNRGSGIAGLDEFARRLKGAVRTDSIGDVDGDETTVLGTIMDVASDEAGRIYVLDMAFQKVRVFDSRGRHQFSVGQRGSGPLDFRFAVAAWVPRPSELMVVDPILGLKQIAVSNQKSLRLIKTSRLDGGATSACGSGGTATVFSPVHDTLRTVVVHRYDSAGRRVLSMGAGYDADSRLVREIMSEGTVACASGGRTIAALSKLPFVQAFEADGRLKWTTRLSNFKIGREVEEVDSRGRRGIGLDPENPDHSYIRRMVTVGDKFVLVQVAVNTAKSLRAHSPWERIDSYLLDLQTGRGTYVSSRLPLITAHMGARLLGFDNDPFPRVITLRLPD